MAYPVVTKIKLKDGKPTDPHGLEVVLPLNHLTLLKGKGEGKYILIRKEYVKYKIDDDSDDNQ